MTYIIVDIETTGLDPLTCEITAIGLAIDGEIRVYAQNEKKNEKVILEDLWDLLNTFSTPLVLVGFNLEFDHTFLKIRSLKHNITICKFDKWKGLLDLRLALNANKFQKGTKLHDYCKGLNIENGDELDGAAMPKLFEMKAYDEIEKHLRWDMKSTQELFQRMQKCKII